MSSSSITASSLMTGGAPFVPGRLAPYSRFQRTERWGTCRFRESHSDLPGRLREVRRNRDFYLACKCNARGVYRHNGQAAYMTSGAAKSCEYDDDRIVMSRGAGRHATHAEALGIRFSQLTRRRTVRQSVVWLRHCRISRHAHTTSAPSQRRV